jgi:hypothetical protein
LHRPGEPERLALNPTDAAALHVQTTQADAAHIRPASVFATNPWG